jgi:hypothetical protein
MATDRNMRALFQKLAIDLRSMAQAVPAVTAACETQDTNEPRWPWRRSLAAQTARTRRQSKDRRSDRFGADFLQTIFG